MTEKHSTWKQHRDGSGRSFSGTAVGHVRVEVYPSLIGMGEWFATVVVGRHRWTTHSATEKSARRAAMTLARAVGGGK